MQCITPMSSTVLNAVLWNPSQNSARNAVQRSRTIPSFVIFAEKDFFMEVKRKLKNHSETKKSILSHFGFGIGAMKKLVVCRKCNSLETNNKLFCDRCNERLPKSSLYDIYKSKHAVCPICGTVLSKQMDYCPQCGAIVYKSENKTEDLQ